MKIAFIGLGLIGGSIAKALRKSNPKNEIIAIDTDEVSLKEALDLNVIDYGSRVVDENLSSCDVIFLCAPVENNVSLLESIKKYIRNDAILTDVGSVKAPIHKFIKEKGVDNWFVGGHPMAGSEKSGFINASEHLLENAFYIITSEKKDDNRIKVLQDLINEIGAIPLSMTPEEHDYYTAAISHLPHLIAAQLVNLVRINDNDKGYMRLIAAGGFKDITRIASSNPTMWQQICNENKENIHILLNKYIDLLMKTDESLYNSDKDIYDLFDTVGPYRLSYEDVSYGEIKKLSSLYVDIADEMGAIAAVSTLLAENKINIKNIGIIHNREFEDGALRIVFKDDVDRLDASEVLTNKGYIIHMR